uniref:FHA domain-containing protein n=1 Tax=Macrostomum lignano TaxID=282301 RepID=A0A1I8FCE4_9PLAT
TGLAAPRATQAAAASSDPDGLQARRQHQHPPASKSRRVDGGGTGGSGSSSGGLRQVGQWKPEDDQLLVQAVLALHDLRAVHCCVRFSCAFAESELRERWRGLLFDRTLSGLAEQAARALPSPIRFLLRRRAPFSHAEEDLLAAALHRHWEAAAAPRPPPRLPSAGLAGWRSRPPTSRTPEFLVERFRSAAPGPPGLPAELDWEPARPPPAVPSGGGGAPLAGRRSRGAAPAARPPEPGDQFVSSDGRPGLALLKGTRASFLISGVCVSLGRRTDACAVDIDLGLEGPSGKISRLHAFLRLLESGAFQLENVGRRPVFVNGEPVCPGEACLLPTPSMLLVGCLAFRFLVNPELHTGRFRRAIAEALRARRECCMPAACRS